MKNISVSHCRHNPSGKGGLRAFLSFFLGNGSLYNRRSDVGQCHLCNSTIRVPDAYYSPVAMSLRMLATVLFALLGNWLYINSELKSIAKIALFWIPTFFGWFLCNRLIASVTLTAYSWKKIDAEDNERIRIQAEYAAKQRSLRIYSLILPAPLIMLLMTDLHPTYMQCIIPVALLLEGDKLDTKRKLIGAGFLFAGCCIMLLIVHLMPELILATDILAILIFCGALLWEGYYK